MRKKISQQNLFPSFNLETEYMKLSSLFKNKSAFGFLTGPLGASKTKLSCSYYDCMNSDSIFLNWKLRGSFIDVEEMLKGLHISTDNLLDGITEEFVLDYIQFLLNAIRFVNSEVTSGKFALYLADDSIHKAIVNNCTILLEKLGAEARTKKNEIFIVYQNKVALAVADINDELKPSIIDYLKIKNRNNIRRKAEILCTLAKYLEPNEKDLETLGFKAICNDTTFLLNNSGIRHYCNPSIPIPAYFDSLTYDETIIWFDRTFEMVVSCMAIVPYLKYKSEIQTIRRMQKGTNK